MDVSLSFVLQLRIYSVSRKEILRILGDDGPGAVTAAQEMPGDVPLWRVEELSALPAADRPAMAVDADSPAPLVNTLFER